MKNWKYIFTVPTFRNLFTITVLLIIGAIVVYWTWSGYVAPQPPFGSPELERLNKIDAIPASVEIGNKDMVMTWDDGYVGEDIIIRSDQKDYMNLGGFSSTFSATNVSNKKEMVTFSFDYPTDWELRSLKRFTGNEEVPLEWATTTTYYKLARWEEVSSITLEPGETQYLRVSFRSPSNGQFFIHAVGDKGAIGKLDPWTVEEDFEDIAEGDLAADAQWTQAGGYTSTISVVASGCYEGSKCAFTNLTDGNNNARYYDTVSVNDGKVYIAGKKTDVSDGRWLFILGDPGDDCGIIWQADGTVDLYTPTASDNDFYTGTQDDTDYVFYLEFNEDDNECAGGVYDGSWTDSDTKTHAFADITQMIIMADAAASDGYWWDIISPDDPTEAAAEEAEGWEDSNVIKFGI